MESSFCGEGVKFEMVKGYELMSLNQRHFGSLGHLSMLRDMSQMAENLLLASSR